VEAAAGSVTPDALLDSLARVELQARLEQLKQEMQSLQERAAQLEDGISFADNPILQALAMQQSAEALFMHEQVQQIAASEDGEQPGMWPASSTWGYPSNAGTQEISTTQFTPHASEAPSTSHPEVTLSPEEMAAFIDMHTPTTPRLHASRLVHPPEERSLSEQEVRSDDHMDYLIERWRERWGRQTATVPQPTTDQQKPREETAE
jgi:hypothetical protein